MKRARSWNTGLPAALPWLMTTTGNGPSPVGRNSVVSSCALDRPLPTRTIVTCSFMVAGVCASAPPHASSSASAAWRTDFRISIQQVAPLCGEAVGRLLREARLGVLLQAAERVALHERGACGRVLVAAGAQR